MERNIIFNTDKLAKKIGISIKDYQNLKQNIHDEFPNDEMMYQLHLLRALRVMGLKNK